MVDRGLLPKSDLPDAYPYLQDIAGLQSGLLDTDVSLSASAETSSGLITDLNAFLSGATTELTALVGSSAVAHITSLPSTDLLPSLGALFANPLDLISFCGLASGSAGFCIMDTSETVSQSGLR